MSTTTTFLKRGLPLGRSRAEALLLTLPLGQTGSQAGLGRKLHLKIKYELVGSERVKLFQQLIVSPPTLPGTPPFSS